jgi:hypothetical protein
VVAGNERHGINATDLPEGRPADGGSTGPVDGEATDNWWGRADGPTADQCVGGVDCSDHLAERPADAGPVASTTGTSSGPISVVVPVVAAAVAAAVLLFVRFRNGDGGD